MTDFKFNANQSVKVKLTRKGEEILRERRESINKEIEKRGGTTLEPFTLKVDEDGYYQSQLWYLMQIFGEHTGLSKANCFNLNMIFLDGEPIEQEED